MRKRSGDRIDLLTKVPALDDPRPMVARALIFRLAIDGLFYLDDPGATWSAAIARDLASAVPLLRYLQR